MSALTVLHCPQHPAFGIGCLLAAYAARDFVRPDEEEEYAQTLIKLMDELTAQNSVEQTFATEIMGATTWRLRRCRLVEEAFGLIEDLNLDPMIHERTEKQQKSVDRARAKSHLILRRSLDELRKLQSCRQLRNPTPEGVRYTREELKAIAKADVEAILAERKLGSFCKTGETPPPAPQPATSFCEKPKFTPRNAPCPCGSGDKYKRCCGKNAPPVLNRAA